MTACRECLCLACENYDCPCPCKASGPCLAPVAKCPGYVAPEPALVKLYQEDLHWEPKGETT